ncbi:MAG: sensor domain-containing diguanylate cyclase [Smithellaceae bacterium]
MHNPSKTCQGPLKENSILEEVPAPESFDKTFHENAQQWVDTFNAINDSVCLIDPNGKIISHNKATERLLGKSAGELDGHFCFEVVHGLSQPLADCPLLQMKNTKRRETKVLKSGDLWLEVTTDPVLDDDKRFVKAIHIMADITDRKLAEEALRESEARHHEREERYRSILDNMEEAYYEIDLKGNMTFFNTTAVKKLGYTENEMMGMNFRQYVDRDSKQKVFDAFHTVFITGEPIKGVDWEIISKTGEKIPVESSISLMRETQGNPVGFRGIIRDVAQRKGAEENLRREEQRFRALAEQSADIIVIVNRKGIITYENRSIERVLGFKPEERIGAGLFDLVHPDDLKYLTDIALTIARDINAPHLRSEMRLRHRDGSWRIFEVTGSSLINNEKIEAGIVNLRDITERKHVEKALRASEARHREREERYRNILDNMEEAYYEVDLKGNLTFFNAAAVANLGYTDNVMMGLNFRQYVDEENARKVFEAYSKVFLTGESIKGLDWEIISKDIGKIPVESSISLIRDIKGNAIGFRGIIRDITERKRAEEALRESEVKFRNLTETAHDAIVTIDMKGIITYANPAAKALAAGIAVVGMALKDFLPPDSVDHYKDTFELLSSGFSETLSYESKIMKPNSDYPLYFDVKSSTLWNHGEPSGVLFVARDATERKRTEEEIRTMAIIDTLTGLYNRRGFITLAEQQMKTAVRDSKKLLLFFIDLDGLKFINDTWGHEEGDHALKRTSIILKQTFRDSDIISRLGGDEFVALVFDSPDLPEVILKRIECRADEENASNPSCQISMSIGVAEYDSSLPCSIHELIYQADQLMYNQKKQKKQMRKYPT